MNNGRMTFRFDGDKGGRRAETAELRAVRETGSVREDKDTVKMQRGEPRNSPYSRTDEYIVDLKQVELPEEVYDTGQYSIIQPVPVRNLWDPEEEHYPLLEDHPEATVDGYGQYGNRYGGSYHTRRPSYWWKFALSIAGALGTGLLLGYAALSFIGGGTAGTGKDTGNAAVKTGIVQGQNAVNEDTGTDITGVPAPETGAAVTAQIPVQVAAASYYLLQYGVFSTPAGAEQARQELLTAGLAAGLDPADGNRVYAGMSPDREQAKLLSNSLKAQGIELYVRELALPAVNRVSYTGTAEAVDGYFTVSSQLLSELSSLSASLLSGAAGGTGNAAVSDLHMQWTQAVKALEPGLTPEGRSAATGLEQSMSRGIAALNEYSKSKAEGLLWEVQEAMMSFLTGQRNLLSTMS
ncbi:SPOR domain-containing protein [Paenibacillus tritici]|uniref:SPOR domain-containing protein n=2 Tax=Paenibacillus tritici TaxID=1873425 RepID=A0ABX2DMV4_9BACL|nr:SPOR domain-containing protein [Paenibacillus tritici]